MLDILRNIIQEVSTARDFEAALSVVVHAVVRELSADACSIFLLDRRAGDYVLMATEGLNKEEVGRIRIPPGRGLVGLVSEREEPLNVSDAETHARFLSVPEAKEEKYAAFLGVPVVWHRKVLGVLVAQRCEASRFGDNEEAFLVTLAAQLAGIIAHAEVAGAMQGRFSMRRHGSQDSENICAGIPGAPGIGMGTGVFISATVDFSAIPDRQPEDVESEVRLLEEALASGREDIRALGDRLNPRLPAEERALFDVYEKMLEPADMGVEMIEAIRRGNWAQGALREVIESHVSQLESLDNAYLRERAVDIRGLGHRVLAHLQRHEQALPRYSEKTILIGEELTAADLAEVPEGCLVGVISARGSGSSHVAILARAMGIPTVMGVSDIPVAALHDQDIVVDGYYGQVYIAPSDEIRDAFTQLAQEERALEVSLEVLRDQPGQIADGESLPLMVNTGLGVDVGLSLAAGAEGVGLYRTEMPFLMRDRFPSGEEQRIMYRQMLASFSPRMVTMRTLDIGGDKSLSYFPVKEDNPFLGWRGIRVSLDHPDIFLTQMRAMLRASRGYNNLRIMLPMITDVCEVDESIRLLKKAYAEVSAEIPDVLYPALGVMVEVPAAVYEARSIARRVDFLSVGSNDLTQYLLAVDRNNARVAGLFDTLHPAVLRALQQVVDAAHLENRPVSICGELAGDPVAVLLLVAMGFDSLSMSASSLPRIKWVIRHFTRADTQTLLKEVLTMESPVMIRSHLELALQQAGLGALIRAGRR